MKKVLSFILVLSMVLSSFGMAFAAPATNEIAGHLNEKATLRLNKLGIVKGDDRGFALDANITRAEFAVLLVRALGLEGSANVAKGETQFTDVTVAAGYEWASGAINVATRLGYIQGYGNGKFGPADQIRYEDAITLVVRALGYEPAAQAKGGYPVGYLVVAEQDIKNTDHVKGAQGVAITRGSVFQLLDNSLTKALMVQVGYGSETKYVVSGQKGTETEKQTILTDKLGIKVVEGIVTANRRVDSKLKANQVKIGSDKYEIAADIDADAILGLEVSAWKDKDDVLFRYEVESEDVIYDTVKSNKLDKKTLKVELSVEDEKFAWSEYSKANETTDAIVYVNNEKVDVDDVPENAYGRFVLNEYKEVAFAYLFNFDKDMIGMAKEVKKDEIDFISVDAIGEDTIDLDKAEEVFVFNADFTKADLKDIKEGTALFGWADEDDNFFIVIKNEVVEGKLEAVRVKDNRVTVKDKNITVADNAIFSDDKGAKYFAWDSAVQGLVDENVMVVLDLAGKGLVLTTDANVTSNMVYGVATYLTEGRNPVLTVFTNEGKEIEYKFEDRKDVTASLNVEYLKDKFVAVGFKLNKDGEIAKGELTVVATESKLDAKKTTDNFVMADSKKYYIRENTVVIKALNKDGVLKPSVIKYDDIVKRAIAQDEKAIVIGSEGRNADLIVFTSKAFEAKDDTLYGLVIGDVFKKGTEFRVKLAVAGKGEEEYVVAEKDTVVKGDYIKFTLNNKGAVTDVVRVNVKDETKAVKVDKVEKDYIQLGGNWKLVDSNTVIYQTNAKGELDGTTRLTKITKDDSVVFLENNKEVVKVLVVVTKYTKVDEQKPVVKGVVTYIDAAQAADDSFKIEVEGKIYVVTNSTVLRNEIGVVEKSTADDIFAVLVANTTQVFDIVANSDNVISSFKYQRTEAQKETVATAAVAALEAAVSAFDTTQAKLDAAKALVKPAEDAVALLKAGSTKTGLADRIAAEKVKIAAEETAVAAASLVTAANDKVAALEAAVSAFDTTQAKLDAAKVLVKPAEDAVAKLPAGGTKTGLEGRIAAEKVKITAQEAAVAAAVETAAVAAVNAANDKFDVKTAVNKNLAALGISTDITTEQADWLFTKAPGTAGALGYADANAIRTELAKY